MTVAAARVDSQATAQISRFVQSLQEPKTPFISPDRFSAALGVRPSSMAEITGVHRNTLRNPASERLQDRMRQMLRVITSAAALTGDLPKALYWFRNEPIVDYGAQTASQLVAAGEAEAVMAYLRDLENGANGGSLSGWVPARSFTAT